MKKRVVIIGFLLLIVQLISVSAFDVEERDKAGIIISELENPAVFDFVINSDIDDSIEIFSLVGVSMSPRGRFDIRPGDNVVEVKAFPNKDLRSKVGLLTFEYQIKHSNGVYKDSLEVKVVKLEDSISVSSGNIMPDDESVEIEVRNLQNTYIDDLSLTFDSEFFNKQVIVSLSPYERKNLSVELDKEKMKKLTAGPYILETEVNVGKANAKVESVLNYLEQQGTSINIDSTGFLIRKTITSKTNEGNVIVIDKIEAQRDIVSRLFTSYSVNPDSVVRKGLTVYYVWTNELNPGASWDVSVRTNYTLPFFFIVLIFIVAFLVTVYSRTSVSVSKRVSFVRTKGGEFALKVILSVKAKEHVDNLQLVDRLPGVTKLYEKFGTKPDRIDESTKRLFWNIPKLQAGEERVFSYIIYSKMNVVGRFELPSALVVYEKDGKMIEGFSNKAFFASETVSTDY